MRRRDVPRRLLVDLARRVPPDLQEILLLRQDAIVEEPAILDALEENPQLTLYTQRRIAEYREHLLPRERRPAEPRPTLVEADRTTTVVGGDRGGRRRSRPRASSTSQTGLSEGQIRMLPVPVRIKLTRGAAADAAQHPDRDTNPQVALSVLRNNAISDQEVEQIARSRSVVEEVLDEIARRREWVAKYNDLPGLVQNPRTPLPMALRPGRPAGGARPARPWPRPQHPRRRALDGPALV